MGTSDALERIDDAIAELEARLNLKPGQGGLQQQQQSKNSAPKKQKVKKAAAPAPPDKNLPPILQIQLKVGVITKVWVHETADKLYCEEIDVGEDAPRLIASGLRPHFTLEQMLGQRLLVVSNLKARNLVGFKSHGMVLCAAQKLSDDGEELVEFVEPPEGALPGEVVTLAGLPAPQPASPAQVEKRKLWVACLDGLRTNDDKVAVWEGHVLTTSAGPCTTKTIAGGVLR